MGFFGLYPIWTATTLSLDILSYLNPGQVLLFSVHIGPGLVYNQQYICVHYTNVEILQYIRDPDKVDIYRMDGAYV